MTGYIPKYAVNPHLVIGIIPYMEGASSKLEPDPPAVGSPE